MTAELQFALTFVTLVVLAAILYIRMTRYEAYLREEKEGIQRLNERLQSLVDGLEALGTKRVEDQLSDIHDVLTSIRDGMARPLPSAPAAEVEPVARGGPLPALIDVVEAKLYNLGYGRVKIVSDLADADPREPVRVVVEAEKEGVAHKGHLVIHGSSVTEMEMQPSYTAFP